jgi:hypothetical protein
MFFFGGFEECRRQIDTAIIDIFAIGSFNRVKQATRPATDVEKPFRLGCGSASNHVEKDTVAVLKTVGLGITKAFVAIAVDFEKSLD